MATMRIPAPTVNTSDVVNGSITLAKQANLAEARIEGRAAGAGTGVPQALTGAQVNAILPTPVPTLIDSATLTAAATYTSPTWAANAYSKIWIELDMTSVGIVTLALNGFASGTGRTAGSRIGATAFTDASDMYLHYPASAPEIGWIRTRIDIVQPAGTPKGGVSDSMTVDVATGAIVNSTCVRIMNSDVSTDVLGFVVSFPGNATGFVKVYAA